MIIICLFVFQSSDPGPFVDITALEKKPAHLSIFLHYLISNSDPSSLVSKVPVLLIGASSDRVIFVCMVQAHCIFKFNFLLLLLVRENWVYWSYTYLFGF